MLAYMYNLICLLKEVSEEVEDMLAHPPYEYLVEAMLPWSDDPKSIRTDEELLDMFQKLDNMLVHKVEFSINPKPIIMEVNQHHKEAQR